MKDAIAKTITKQLKVFVTIPAYNEEKSIGDVIDDVKKVMDKTNYHFGVMVLDDGSSDNTAKVAKKYGAIVYSHPRNMGLAEVFRTEMEKCLEHGADVIIHIDADRQYRASDIPKLLKEIENGNDFVLGSRFLGNIESMPFIKKIGNKAFSRVISKITKCHITDGQTGMRAFTKEVASQIKIISNHTYTQEQIIRVAKAKFKIKEVPVYFDKRKDGNSRLMSNPFNYAIRAWVNLFRIYRDYEPLKFFGYFGSLFFLPGFLVGLWVLHTFFTTGLVGALPRVLLSVLFISIGVQIWLFGFLADMNRK